MVFLDPRVAVTSLNPFYGAIVVLFIILVIRKTRTPKEFRLPPGPQGRPLVGNLFDMPLHHEWETFTRWAREYGDLFYLNVVGTRMLCINSVAVSQDLFETRSSIYSDRYDFPMLKLAGFEFSFAAMRYTERWRRHRKAFHQHFHPTASTAYHDIQMNHTRDLLHRLRESPDDFVEHLRHLGGATITEIVYGIKVLPKGDPYIRLGGKAMAVLEEAGKPGAFLVDNLPFLKYVPAWMPGAGFQRKAQAWRLSVTEMAVRPFIAVKNALSAGTAGPSVVASLLDELSYKPDAPADEEEVIRNVAAVAYVAGSESIVSTLSTFILAMVLYPEVQQKAQAELDAVIGTGRLPTFEDRQHLPYVNALCKETYRWHPVAPLGIPHRVSQDDYYGDYYIPCGSLVFGNVLAILHDEKEYGPEPTEFRPERFLKPGVKDPTSAFGFGRRICPGRYMADNSVYIAIASILQVYNIRHARNDRGEEIPVGPLFTSGFLSRPEEFQCEITPRSSAAESLLFECV